MDNVKQDLHLDNTVLLWCISARMLHTYFHLDCLAHAGLWEGIGSAG